MLDVSRFWDDEGYDPQYDDSCSTLSTSHLSSHIRTQYATPTSMQLRRTLDMAGFHDFGTYSAPYQYASSHLSNPLSTGRDSQPIADEDQETQEYFDTEHLGTRFIPNFSSRSSALNLDEAHHELIHGDVREVATCRSPSPTVNHSAGDLPTTGSRANSAYNILSPHSSEHLSEPGCETGLSSSGLPNIYGSSSRNAIEADGTAPFENRNLSPVNIPGNIQTSASIMIEAPSYYPAAKRSVKSAGFKKRPKPDLPQRLDADLSVTSE